MAQAESTVCVRPTGPPTGPSSMLLSDGEIFEIQQYKKIVQLRDAILSGKHPTLKAPPGSNASLEPLTFRKTLLEPRAVEKKIGAGNDDGHDDVSPTILAQPSSGPPELNPIFLEKSDQLVKAELQIQRQRLERAIKEEAEQRRVAKNSQAELTSDLDLSDVLAKALTLAQSTSAPTAGETLTANVETTSDSLDDSTFYSSRHDTPESHLTSRIRNQSDEVQPTNNQELPGEASRQAIELWPRSQGETRGIATRTYPARLNERNNTATACASETPLTIVPGLNNYVQVQETSQTRSGEERLPGDKGRLEVAVAKDPKPSSSHRHPNNEDTESHPPFPLVRNHTLQPVAPQPTHPSALSALATASSTVPDAPIAGGRSAVGTPAHIAALRNQSNAVTSPDSSSQGGRRRGRKMKRKADRQAPEPEATPYIKPEPRSPSPIAASSYLRPWKRPRHNQEPPVSTRHEPRYIQGDGVQYVTRQYREVPIPVGQARPAAHHQPPSGDVRDHSGQYYDVRQARVEDAEPRSARVDHSTIPYPSRAASIPRPVSQVMVPDPYAAPSWQYHDYRDGPRMAVRAEGDTLMAPPRTAHSRILVGSHGREYIEPLHHSPSRISATSPFSHGEHEVLYERLPPRAVSRHPATGPYDDGGVVYAPSNPAYVMLRRVVTQPEYVGHDYRDVWKGDFPARPPPPGEFVQVLAPPERRYYEESYGR